MTPLEAVGVDLGGTKMAVAVVDLDLSVHHEEVLPSVGLTQDELVERLAGALERARTARPAVVAAGLGIPCTIDQGRGLAITAVNLPIRDLQIRDLMAERIGIPVAIDNDATVAALAEHRFGAARGFDHAVVVTVGTGIGGGLILNGRTYSGTIGAGSELGHTVVDLNGPRCQGSCPNRGCVEVMASGTALARDGRAAAELRPESELARVLGRGEEVTGRVVVEAARAGDEAALAVVESAGRHLGAAFSSWANIFNPDVIVVGGGVASGAGEVLLEPARAELRARALPPMDQTRVVEARFGPEAGVVGAAVLAMDRAQEGG